MSPRLVGLALLAALPALGESPQPPPGPVPVEAAPAAPAPAEVADPAHRLERLLADADAAWTRRDEPGQVDEIRARLADAERLAPDAYGVLWRQAQLNFWLSDDPDLADDRKSTLGKVAWDYGDRATRANPGGVEGWHFSAGGMGNYSLGIGILRALAQGIEGKFRERLSRAEAIDPAFQNGAIQTAWGRFWYKLPWPKYDPGKSEKALRAALARNPGNVRALVYLGDLLRSERHRDEARAAWERALEKPPGQYDAPEERRYQAVARRSLERDAR
jgi:tetratricopeptide (TPR) repeat protein